MSRKNRAERRQEPSESQAPAAESFGPASGPSSVLRGALVLLALVLVAYLPARTAGFIWDDDDYVTENETLETFGGLGRIWFEIGATPQYYPLVHTTFWLEYRLWQESSTGYHTVNILLHAAAAFLVWRILRRLSAPGAFIAALLFAVHPIEVESVAWVTERKNVLSGVCYLGALLAYLRFAGVDGLAERTGKYWGWAFALFVCALLSKTITASLPAAILLIFWWKRGRLAVRDVVPLLPFFATGVAAGLLTAWMEKNVVGAEGLEWSLSLVEHLLLAGRIAWFYAIKIVWPEPLVFIYPRWEIDAGAAAQYAFPILAAGLIGAAWFFRSRIGRGPLTAILFYGGSLVPALGFVAVYPMRFSYVADHFQYLAGLGVLTLIAAGLTKALRLDQESPGARLAPAGAIVLLLAGLTWRQCHAYKDLETLWRDTIAKNPDAWIAHNNLGRLLLDRGDTEEAVVSLKRAIELNPDYSDALNNLANTLVESGRADEAIAYYENALEHAAAKAPIHVNLGNALEKLDRLDEAKKHADETIRLEPEWGAGFALRGRIAMKRRRTQDALYDFDKAVAFDPNDAPSHISLGILLGQARRLEEAIEHLRTAVRLDPRSSEAQGALGFALTQSGRPEDAIAQWRSALALSPGNTTIRVMLADLLLQTGDRDAAAKEFEEVLKVDPGNQRARAALGQ